VKDALTTHVSNIHKRLTPRLSQWRDWGQANLLAPIQRLFVRIFAWFEQLSPRRLAAISAVGLLAIVLNSIVAANGVRSVVAIQQQVTHTQIALTALENIMLTMDTAETGQRGYVITGQAKYLQPYNAAVGSIGSKLDALPGKLDRAPDVATRLQTLNHLISEKLQELAQTVSLRQQGQTAEALQISDSNRGQEVMDQIRTEIEGLQTDETAVLNTQQQAAERGVVATILAIALATLGDLALIGFFYLVFFRVILRRDQRLATEQAARAESEQALQVRNQFLSIAAHELKTPLTSLSANAQLLQRRIARANSDQASARMATLVIDQSRRLNQLIDTMLDVTRIEAGQLRIERRPTQVVALVQRLVDEYVTGDSHHRVSLTLADPALVEVTIEGDDLRLEQVIRNLLSNAIKYSPGKDLVEIHVSRRDGWLDIAVRDEGIGIPAEALPHLFEQFYRAPNTQDEGRTSAKNIEGFGIGLYVTREIVRQHGGELTVKSQSGVGSVFTLSLPLVADPPKPSHRDATSETAERAFGPSHAKNSG